MRRPSDRPPAMATGPTDPQPNADGSKNDPRTEPIMKNGSATIIRPEPLPKLYNTPDPQPFASCMPRPKIKAPTNNEIVTGATVPAALSPSADAGIKTIAHKPISRKWAASPITSPRTSACRQTDAKPYWNSKNTTPNKPPRIKSPTPVRPVSRLTNPAINTARLPKRVRLPLSKDNGRRTADGMLAAFDILCSK